ncbi:hypothetical protein IMG5_202040 [Ichthyophthirius multifiliis]|uniref:Uncharacterized protein n=1 Tax=Ichthyophthirius multifiliis TaxID=5932 RepID=G0R621_ICHMU|nr:hypothetical protein IMG5_202040 [Ichthyophthirius multifiliis]EGR27087.1 hypothetical protein IMG5_202040 [Ichthyophthirius multifiliis]|eukprot:XP_004023971.1 hypothetical protein IMG5_202040 [Ichthyophthirius multifiliis]
MPPKNKKELELEAQRLLEEQQKREEEERLQKEEDRKKYGIRQLETGLQCIFTDYYIKECSQTCEDIRKFTREYLENHYFNEIGINQNFREIDWKSLIEFNLYNLLFAKHTVNMSDQQAKIFINIMFQVYIQDDLKFEKVQIDENLEEKEKEVFLEDIGNRGR